MSAKKFRTLDVRPLLKRGGEPFTLIVQTVGALQPNEGLLLRTPFLPSPMIEQLKSQGFAANPRSLPDGSWQTIVTKQQD